MSTLMTAAESRPLPLDENKSEGKARGVGLWSRQVACAALLILTDVSTIALSLSMALFLQTGLLPHLDGPSVRPLFRFWHYLAVLGWIFLALPVFLGIEGLYTQRRTLWNEVGHVTKAVGLSVIAILATLALAQPNPLVTRATILLTGLNLFILLSLMRCCAKWILGKLGLWRKRILILGAAETAHLAIRGLTSDPVLGYEVAGLLDNDPLKKGKHVPICEGKSVYVLGNLSQAREQMVLTHARDVLIAMPDLPEEELLAIVHQLQPHCDSIYVVPHRWGLPMMNLHIDGFLRERVMVLKLSNNLAKPWNIWLKRSLDLVLGALLTLLVLPLGVVLAALIKMDSEGPALFVQERIGYRGRRFRCIKFRTMLLNGDQRLEQYLESNPHAADEWQRYAKLRKYDPRLTRLGRFLRRWSLDELPQLLNVLKGEMSLIGPRPYLPEERSRIGADFSTILSARPGVTGFWQVNGHNHVTIDERVQLEAWYVRNWTVWLDCIVLAKTFRAVVCPHSTVGATTPAMAPNHADESSQSLPSTGYDVR